MRYFLTVAMMVLMVSQVGYSETPVRVKDIGQIIEARDNQLLGFGLVVGLRNTGDSKQTLFTNKALTNLLKKMGISPEKNTSFSSRNVAGVMVTASLPPFTKQGQKIPVTVSALGDSTSLVGGTLLLTPLQGADMNTYAVAQGPVLVGGLAGRNAKVTFFKNQTTVGRIPEGAIVEREVAVTPVDQHHITLVLDESNFITASRVAEALEDGGFYNAKAMDPNTIKVPLQGLDITNMVDIVAKIENIEVVPDAYAKVVINSRTGTVVIGEKVRLYPVALTHGNVSVRIAAPSSGSDKAALLGGRKNTAPVSVREPNTKIVQLNPNATLSSLVKALNEIGASPKDLISIIQALKESGALVAQLEVL